MASKTPENSVNESLDGQSEPDTLENPDVEVEILYGDEGLDNYHIVSQDHFESNYRSLEGLDQVLVAFKHSELREGDLDVVSEALESGAGVLMPKNDYTPREEYESSGLEALPEWYNADDHLKDRYWASVDGDRDKFYLIED